MNGISALIASKDREKICEKLVRQIHTQLSTLNIPFEILVCDDCSAKPYKFKSAKIIRNSENLGAPKSRNKLITLSKFDTIFVTDDDVELGDNVLESLAETMNNSGANIVFPKKLDIYQNHTIKEYSCFKPRFFSGNLKKILPKHLGKVKCGSMTYLAKKMYVWYDEDFGLNQFGVKGYDVRVESAMQILVEKKIVDLNCWVFHFADFFSKDKRQDLYWIGYGNALFIKRYLALGFFRSWVWICSWGVAHFLFYGRDFNIFKGWVHGMLR